MVKTHDDSHIRHVTVLLKTRLLFHHPRSSIQPFLSNSIFTVKQKTARLCQICCAIVTCKYITIVPMYCYKLPGSKKIFFASL